MWAVPISSFRPNHEDYCYSIDWFFSLWNRKRKNKEERKNEKHTYHVVESSCRSLRYNQFIKKSILITPLIDFSRFEIWKEKIKKKKEWKAYLSYGRVILSFIISSKIVEILKNRYIFSLSVSIVCNEAF